MCMSAAFIIPTKEGATGNDSDHNIPQCTGDNFPFRQISANQPQNTVSCSHWKQQIRKLLLHTHRIERTA